MSCSRESAFDATLDERSDAIVITPRPIDRLTVMRALGAEVRALRRRLNLNQKELAHIVGLSHGMISKIEHGRTTPSLEALVAIAQRLCVPIAELFAGLGKKSPAYYIPAGTGMTVVREGSEDNFVHQLLGHFLSDDRASELYHISSAKDGRPFCSRQEGFSCVYMLSGKIDYRHGERIYTLTVGDTLYFDAASVHGPNSIIESPVSYLLWRQVPSNEERMSMKSQPQVRDRLRSKRKTSKR